MRIQNKYIQMYQVTISMTIKVTTTTTTMTMMMMMMMMMMMTTMMMLVAMIMFHLNLKTILQWNFLQMENLLQHPEAVSERLPTNISSTERRLKKDFINFSWQISVPNKKPTIFSLTISEHLFAKSLKESQRNACIRRLNVASNGNAWPRLEMIFSDELLRFYFIFLKFGFKNYFSAG